MLAWIRDRPRCPQAGPGVRDLAGHRVPVPDRGQIDRWYSGKAHHPGGNIRALSVPRGVALWVSGVLPGSIHDLTAACELVLPEARPYLADLPFAGRFGVRGRRCGHARPGEKPACGELDPDTKTRNALLRSLRYQGVRGFPLMTQQWRTVQRVMLSPGKIGDNAQAALVLVLFEHKRLT